MFTNRPTFMAGWRDFLRLQPQLISAQALPPSPCTVLAQNSLLVAIKRRHPEEDAKPAGPVRCMAAAAGSTGESEGRKC